MITIIFIVLKMAFGISASWWWTLGTLALDFGSLKYWIMPIWRQSGKTIDDDQYDVIYE